MILDSTNNLELYKSISRNINNGINHLINNDYSKHSPGKYDVDENSFVLVNHYKTKSSVDCKLESHKKYIDIQLMYKGNEKVGYAVLNNQTPSEEYSEEKDVMFFNFDHDVFLLRENMFAIFFPHDIHKPGIAINKSEDVIKIVMKISFDL